MLEIFNGVGGWWGTERFQRRAWKVKNVEIVNRAPRNNSQDSFNEIISFTHFSGWIKLCCSKTWVSHLVTFSLSEIAHAPSLPPINTQPSTGSEACCLCWAYCTTIQKQARKRENLGKLKTRERLRVKERKRRDIYERRMRLWWC